MKRGEGGKECGQCSKEERYFLHNIKHRGSYRRLCTSCVLKNNAGNFCPVCFFVYDDHQPPPSHQRLLCHKCSSIAHLSCLPSHSHSAPYECPPCSSPYFSFFPLSSSDAITTHNKPKQLLPLSSPTTTIPSSSSPDVKEFKIDLSAAKVLLAAARLASSSMNRAASSARSDAEKRAREASVARKRASEALERLFSLERDRSTTTSFIASNTKAKLECSPSPSPTSALHHNHSSNNSISKPDKPPTSFVKLESPSPIALLKPKPLPTSTSPVSPWVHSAAGVSVSKCTTTTATPPSNNGTPLAIEGNNNRQMHNGGEASFVFVLGFVPIHRPPPSKRTLEDRQWQAADVLAILHLLGGFICGITNTSSFIDNRGDLLRDGLEGSLNNVLNGGTLVVGYRAVAAQS
ncbi:hypothetical protein RJ641_020927 [Dillenia turbinata]|uniref:Uncharacterized protein n=1 Tax=Dillenia turbinata TaxID=194707 RepID=A0AAN8YUI8_9MAGN